jgi:hypothetical protein
VSKFRGRANVRSKLLRLAPILFLAVPITKLTLAYAVNPAPQSMVVIAAPIDLSRGVRAARANPPVPVARHFANPALIGQVKAALAAASKSSRPSKHGGGPTPAPSPNPTPVPLSALAPNPVPTTAAIPGLGFLDGGGYIPPDTIVTAGSVSSTSGGVTSTTTELLEAVNLDGEVYSTSGSPIASLSITDCTPNPLLDSVSDPRVLFDQASGRWFISLVTFSPASDAGWDLLISQSSDPSGTWACLYIPTSAIQNPDGTTGNFPDFPKIGINEDKVILSGDAFSTVQKRFSASYKFQGTEFVVINKSELVAPPGTSIYISMFNPPQGDFAIEPAQQLGATSSSGDSLYMAAVNSAVSSASSIDVWTVSGVPTAQTAPTATRTSLPIYTISTPPNAEQAGTSVLIDTNDDSLLDAVFRDGSPGSLWVSANDGCVPAADSATRSCLRFIEVSVDSTGMKVAQDFDYADKGSYYYYPAIRTDSAGDLVTVFSGSSSNTFASVYAGRRLATDPSNNLTGFSLIQAGVAAYTTSPPRWGDYSGAGVDPDDTTVWIAGEYVATVDIFFGPIWGTWIASVP